MEILVIEIIEAKVFKWKKVQSTDFWKHQLRPGPTEPVFLNVYGTQESILRNEFRQPK